MENDEQEWIEAPDGWGSTKEEEESTTFDLFGSDDKSETFTYDIQLDKDKCCKIILSGFKLDSDETDHSTGATLWQAAPRLADYINQNSKILCKGKSILELGGGLGLCGIVAYYSGAKKVIMTDGDTKTLKGMRANVKHNCDNDVGDRIQCKQLLWGSPHMNAFLEENGQYDTIIAADVIYTKDSIVPLMQTVACLLEKSGQFVLSRYTKWHSIEDETVIELAKQQGLECTQLSKGIFIFRHSNI